MDVVGVYRTTFCRPPSGSLFDGPPPSDGEGTSRVNFVHRGRRWGKDRSSSSRGLLQTGGLVVVMDVYARRPTAAPRMRQSLDRRGLMMMDGWMDGGRPGERGGTRSDGAILTTVIVGRQGLARPRLACRHVNSALCRVTRHWHGAWPGTTTWTMGIEKKKSAEKTTRHGFMASPNIKPPNRHRRSSGMASTLDSIKQQASKQQSEASTRI